MFCPVCKAEYRKGFTRCADCDVELVASLEKPPSEDTQDEPATLLWQGQDPVVFTAILNALRAAEIPSDGSPGVDFAAGLSRSPYSFSYGTPGLEIRVSPSELEKAQRVLDSVLEASSTGLGPNFQSEAELPSELADASPAEVPEQWHREQATAEVWAGEDEAMAQFLADIFRENAIASRALAEGSGRQRILVRAEDVDRAGEIVREVLKGTPPE